MLDNSRRCIANSTLSIVKLASFRRSWLYYHIGCEDKEKRVIKLGWLRGLVAMLHEPRIVVGRTKGDTKCCFKAAILVQLTCTTTDTKIALFWFFTHERKNSYYKTTTHYRKNVWNSV